MKKTLTITAMFLCAWAWAQQAALYVGSDWDEASIALRAAWDKPDFAKQAGVTLTVVDQPEHVDAEVQAKWKQLRRSLLPTICPASRGWQAHFP